MSLSLKVSLRVETDAGLLGGVYEYAPVLSTWATFGAHSVPVRSAPLATSGSGAPATVGAYTLPAASSVHGDEAVWLKVMSTTTLSGVPSIDATDDGHCERMISSGAARCALGDLLDAAHAGKTIEQPFMCPLFLKTAYTNLMANATAGLTAISDEEAQSLATVASYKGTLIITPSLTATAHPLRAAITQKQARPGARLLYDTPALTDASVRMQNLLVGTYIDRWVGTPAKPADPLTGKPAKPAVPARYAPNPLALEAQDLHIPLFVNEFGDLPLVAIAQDRHSSREPIVSSRLSAADKAFYGPRRGVALIANTLLSQSVQRVGLTSDAQFIAAVDQQHTQSPSDASISAAYLDALNAIAKMGTFVANRVDYTVDMRYCNKATLSMLAHFRPPPPTTTTATTTGEKTLTTVAQSSVVQRVAAAMRAPRLTMHMAQRAALAAHPVKWGFNMVRGSEDSTEGGGGAPESRSVEIEDMMSTAVYMHCRADDCDGSQAVSTTVLRGLERLSRAVTREEAPVLHAAVRALSRMFICPTISMVNGGYVDANGKALTGDERKKMTDLPRIGDAQDKQCQTGGHCHGLMISRAVVVDALARGGEFDVSQLKSPTLRNFSASERRCPIYVLEGTGATDAQLLSAGEVAQAVMKTGPEQVAFEARAVAQHAFVKGEIALTPPPSSGDATAAAASSGASSTTTTVGSPLLRNSIIDGLAFYTSKQANRMQRVAAFYLSVASIVVPDLYDEHPLLGHLSFINHVEQTRAADFGNVLRMPFDGAQSQVGLVPTLHGVTRAQWDTHVRPVMAAVQSQMPVAGIDHFEDAHANDARARIGQVLPTPVLLAVSAKAATLPIMTALDSHAAGVQHRLSNNVTPAMSLGHYPLTLNNGVRGGVVDLEARKNVLCFYYKPWTLADTPLMTQVVQHLDAYKATGKILAYQFTRDQPLIRDGDIITLAVTLPNK